MQTPRARHLRHLHVYHSKERVLVMLVLLMLPIFLFLALSKATSLVIPELTMDLGVSIGRIFVGYCISLVCGWLFAVALYKSVNSWLLPFFDVMQSFPAFAALPLIAYIWGASEGVIITFVVLNITWPIFFSVLTSLRLIKRDWEEAASVVGLKGWNYFRYFLAPASVPGLITGSIIGLGDGWQTLVATEVIVRTPIGLGGFFDAHSTNPVVTTFGVCVFLVFIFILNRALWTPLLLWSQRHMEE